MGGEKAPVAGLAHQVAGAADPLQAAGYALGRLELDHQVDVADVDAQLQRRGAHQRRQAALLEGPLQVQAGLAADAAVVGAERPGDGAGALDTQVRGHAVLRSAPRAVLAARLARQPQVVEPVGGAFRLAAAVGKDQRRVVGLDQIHAPGG